MSSPGIVSTPGPVHRAPRSRPVGFVFVGVLAAALLSALVFGMAFAPVGVLSAPYSPAVEDGYLAEPIPVGDAASPAISHLTPELRAALERAAHAAAADGVRLQVTSGWRSARLQQWMLERAVRSYGSEQEALQWVAAPDRSHHVTGAAVDIGPVEGQLWLEQHGAQWGLCRAYGNESWHFELLTSPGGTCPPPHATAAH